MGMYPTFGMLGGQFPGFDDEDTGSDGSFDAKPRFPKRRDPLLDLLEQPSPSVESFKNYITERPTREQFAPSAWDKISGALVGAFHGPEMGRDVATRKFDTALSDYRLRGEGLEDQARIEEADLNRRVRAANYSGQLENREAERAHREAQLELEREKAEEAARHNRAAEGKVDLIEIRDPDDPTKNIQVDKKTGRPPNWGTGTPVQPKLGAAELGHVSDAKNILLSAKRIRKNLPSAEKSIGPVAGNWQQIKQKLGISKDAAAIRVSRELEALEMIHSKVLVGRGSYMVAKLIEQKFKNIDQFKEALEETLNVLEDQAKSSIKARTGADWSVPDDNGEGAKEYKTKSGRVFKVRKP